MTSVERIKYETASASSIEINMLYLEEMNAREISTKKKQKMIIMKHDSSVSIYVIATTVRTSIKKNLKTKEVHKKNLATTNKKKRLSTSKSIRSDN